MEHSIVGSRRRVSEYSMLTTLGSVGPITNIFHDVISLTQTNLADKLSFINGDLLRPIAAAAADTFTNKFAI